MPIIPLALPKSSNQGEHPHLGAASVLNAYVVANGEEQKAQLSIRAAAGLESLATLSATGGIRGIIEVGGVAYVVAGRTLYQVDSGGTSTLLGGIPSDGYVGMSRNQRGTGVQTTIVAEGQAWVVVGGTLAPITDTDLPPPVDCCTINQSTIFAASDGRMARSEINDSTNIDGLDIARANASPDDLMRLAPRGGAFLAIGERSIEPWTDIGAEAFGFSRGETINLGAIGPKSVVIGSYIGPQSVTDCIAWPATTHEGSYSCIVMMLGTTPQPISTPYIDRLVSRETDKSIIIGTNWVERGNSFFAWRLSDRTVVYNTRTGLWSERQSRDTLGDLTAWKIGLTETLAGKVLAGDATSPKLYWLDPDTYDEAGDEMIVRIITPPASAEPGRIDLSGGVYLDMVPGVGLATGAAEDIAPTVALRISEDGETWTTERSRSIGALGQRQTRVRWSRCGTWAQASMEFTCSARVAREFVSAHYDGKAVRP